MIRIAIVEDEEEYAAQLQDYLHQYEEQKKEVFQITCFRDGDGILNGYRPEYDIILMDVQMKFVDGLSAAKEIRKVDKDVVIIFITNMRQYAIQGYAVEALDYIVKPVTYFAFSERLARAIERKKRNARQFFVINIRSGMLRIALDDIYYVESRGHTLIYHTASGDYESGGTMKDAVDALTGHFFCQGNKGYLINLSHVDGIQDGCAIVRGEKLLLSRGRKNAFLEELTNYWSEVR